MTARRVLGHIKSNAVAYVALFFALTGSAAAVNAYQVRNSSIGTGAVNSRTIKNHGVGSIDIRHGAIRSKHVLDHSLRERDIATGAIDGRVVKDGSLRGADVANNSLTGANVANNSLTGAQIDEATLDPNVVQARVRGGCPTGQAIRDVALDGAITCESTGTGTITSVSTSGGLTGGGNSGDVHLGVDATKLQRRVTGACTGNDALQSVNQDGTVTCQPTGTGTVTSVDSGTGLTGGPITTSGTLSVDPAQVQSRVSGTCSGSTALQHVNQNGTVVCSPSLQTAGHVLTPDAVTVSAGASATLFSANGIVLTAVCTSGGNPEVTIGPTGNTTVITFAANSAASSNGNYGLVTGSPTSAQTISTGAPVVGDHVYFDAFANDGSAGSRTLSGSFQSYPASSACVYSGTAEAS